MAQQFSELDERLSAFIRRQNMFFTASAAAGSRVNVSPRSTDCFRISGPNAVFFLDRTGSGNETAAHLKADGRLTIMFCAVAGPPMIMRLYGTGRVLHRDTQEYATLLDAHFPDGGPSGARQIVFLDVDLVQTSCGYGVPLFEYQSERPSMDNWTDKKGPDGIRGYWHQENRFSMDGLPTGIFDPPDEPATSKI
ncbi:MAG: pyridoxamine 5'-phosphate oxidase family protein [Pseudomonadota bacterium]